MNKVLLSAAFAGLFTATTSAAMANDHQHDQKANQEKCYGIAKAGKNSCAAGNGKHSCAGQATTDNDPHEWVFTAPGECEKQGGSLKTPE